MGVSQEIFARMLGISRSQVAMYESGKRTLPTDSLIKLGQLRHSRIGRESVPLSPEMQEMVKQSTEKHIENLRNMHIRYTRLLEKAVRKLHELKEEEIRSVEALQLTSDELSLFEGVSTYEIDLQTARKEAFESWQRSHAGHQLVAEHRIAELKALIGVTQTTLESLGSASL